MTLLTPGAGQTAARDGLVGRLRERAELRRALDDARAGRGRLVLLAGEPGIGKTRLADALAGDAAASGALVAWGHCWEGGGAPAYFPWVEILRRCARACPPDVLTALTHEAVPPLAALLGQVLPRPTAAPPPAAVGFGGEGASDRFQLFDAVGAFLTAAAAARPLVVVFDDAHAADVASLLLLRFLARGLRHQAALLLVTYRDTEVRRDATLAGVMADLAREGATLALRGLSEDEVREWMSAGREPAPAPTAAAVHRITGGNPFFVSELVRLLSSEARLPADAEAVAAMLDAYGIPDGVRVAIRRRLALASPAAQRALTVGAVGGREFDAAAICAASGLSAAELQAALDDAVACGLVSAVGDRPGRYRFCHALIGDTLARALPRAERGALHLAIAQAVETRHAAALEPHLAELAHHYARALPHGPASKAIEFAARGARHAESVLASEEASRLYVLALEVLEAQPAVDEARRCELLLGLGESCFGAGYFERTRTAFRRAAESARRLGSSEHLARAALGYGLPPIAPYTVDEVLVGMLEDALCALAVGDSPLRAMLFARLASELHWSEARARGVALSHEAVAMARRLGDPAALVYALFMRHLAAWSLDNLEERLAIATEIVELASRVGAQQPSLRAWELRARYYRFVDLLELGAVRQVDAEIERYHALATALRQQHGYEELARATRALMDGRLADADAFAERALAIAQRLERRVKPFRQAVNSQRLMLRREQGRVAELLPLFRASRRGAHRSWVARASLALCYATLERRAEAAAEWEQLAAADFASVPRDAGWMATMVLLAEVCGYLGDAPRAAELYRLLAPYAARAATLDIHVCYGSAAQYLGILAATRGEHDVAEAHFRAAEQHNLAMGAALWTVRTQYHYARLLLRRDRGDDCARAAALAEGAHATASALGLQAILAPLGQLAAEAGARRTPDGRVTILFTDLQDSSGLTERLGDHAAQELLREHNAIVRAQVAAHRGFEVKTTGDGFMLAFGSAQRALGCAVATQRAFAARNQRGAGAPLRVSIGLHSGEAIFDGGDFFGKVVIVAARLAAQARGGEILLSDAVRGLIEDAGGVRFEAGRLLALKGLAGTHRVYTARWDAPEFAAADRPPASAAS